uniref:twin-arginine translocation signal domain-containing protein n=1 Tax=Streptococcus pneumoniae TaxID=1313 RepID=UPI0013DD45ED
MAGQGKDKNDRTGDSAVTGATADRRDFLKAMTGASALAATAVVASEPAAAQAPGTGRESRDERRKARY